MLTLEKVTAGYYGKPVVQDVSLEIEPGIVMTLIGPNGSGKTTLMRLVSGVLPLSSGTINYQGEDISKLSVQELARKIAVVPQLRILPPAFTVREVVALGRTPYLNWMGQLSTEDQQRIDQVLTRTNLLELEYRVIAELSGGEQQRVLLARALAQQTPVLLLDEPTTHLDLQYQVSLMEIVHRLVHPTESELAAGVAKKAVFVAMHDLNLVTRYADRVALMVGGRITASGTPHEVLTPEILSKAYNLPLTILHDPDHGLTAVLPSHGPIDI
jgi:ABC-type cobalamin/Fe3+-siderophores transport system ATPase subunit